MVRCEICGSCYKSYKALSSHIKVHDINSQDYYDKFLKNGDDDKCAYCGHTTRFTSIAEGYNKYCSRKCSGLGGIEARAKTCIEKYGCICSLTSPEVRKKTKATLMSNYGVDHPSKSKEVRTKVKNTVMEKYGVDNVFQSEEVKQKYNRTIKERYKVDHISHSPKMREKAKQTVLQRYGVEYPSQSKKVQNNIKKTNLERYGYENAFQNKEIQEKFKQTMNDRYGTENPSNIPEVIQKIIESKRDSYYDELFTTDRLNGEVIPDFTREEYEGIEKKYSWMCTKCSKKFKANIDNGSIPRCYYCHPWSPGLSEPEESIRTICKQYFPNSCGSTRSILSSCKELDIYIPERNLAIEVDGLYWHSEAGGKNDAYHLNKTTECQELGIQLIHIFEDECRDKQEIIKAIIKKALGVHEEKIHSDDCFLSGVPKLDALDFLEKNHILGGASGNHFGLYCGNVLVSIMTVKKYNKTLEILRYCDELCVTVRDSFSTFLKFFMMFGGEITFECDCRFPIVHKLLQNVKCEVQPPRCFYVGNGCRYELSSLDRRVVEELDNYDPTLSDWENLKQNKYTRIWDCGSNVYIWNEGVSVNE